MVGDSLEDDVEGARALGMRAYLVDRDGQHRRRGRPPDPARAPGSHRGRDRCLTARASTSSPRAVEESLETPVRGLMWSLGLGAFGLAWSITTVAAYLPPRPRRVHPLGHAHRAGPRGGGPLRVLHAALRRADERRDASPARPAAPLHGARARAHGGLARAASVHAELPGDGARPLRLLLRVLHLRAALPRPLSRPRAGQLLRPGPGRPARPARDRARRRARRRRLPSFGLGALPLHPRRRSHPGLVRRGGRARPREGRGADRASSVFARSLRRRGASSAARSTCAAS